MDQPKRRRGDRRDGVLLRELDSLHYITGIIYPNRCDNEAYVSLRIDLTAMNEYLARKNETEGRLRRIDTMEAHWGEIVALLAALALLLVKTAALLRGRKAANAAAH